MRHGIYLIVLLAALALGASEAQAHTTITCDPCSRAYQRWVDEAKVPTPDVTLTVVETDLAHGCPVRDMNYACTSPAEKMIWQAPASGAKATFYHELGHNADHYMLPEWMRAHFMAIMRLPGSWWVAGDGRTLEPAEWFAEAYAECAVKPFIPLQAHKWLGRGPIFGGMPLGGIERHNTVCRMLTKL